MDKTEEAMQERVVYHINKISDTSLLYMRMNFLITVTISQLTDR